MSEGVEDVAVRRGTSMLPVRATVSRLAGIAGVRRIAKGWTVEQIQKRFLEYVGGEVF